jgi:uncharacterized phiE125 gp8 family phage protein
MTHAVVSSTGYTGPVGRELVTAPTEPLLRIEDVRARLRVPFTDEDGDLQAFIEAATVSTEESLGRKLLPQTWRFWYDAIPSGRDVVLPEPVRSIVAVKSYTTDDDASGVTLAATEYVLDVRRGRLVFDEATTVWPPSTIRARNAWSIEATVGYATVGEVPAPILQAIQVKVQAMFLRTSEPPAVGWLLAPYRYRMGVA